MTEKKEQTEIQKLINGILSVVDQERTRLSLAAKVIQLLGQAMDPGNNIAGVGVASLLNDLVAAAQQEPGQQEPGQQESAPAPAPAPAADRCGDCMTCKNNDICRYC